MAGVSGNIQSGALGELLYNWGNTINTLVMALSTQPKKNAGSARGPGRPTSHEAESKTAGLLDIATQVFLECGYERAKISDIVARAGGSKGTLYARYPTKSDLFTAVVERRTEAMEQAFASRLSVTESLPKVLEDFGTNLFQTMHHPELSVLFRIIVAEAAMFPDLARRFLAVGPLRSVDLLSQCLDKHPEFCGDSARDAAESFCSLCLGVPLMQKLLDSDFTISEKSKNHKLGVAIRIFVAANCR